MTTSFSYLYFIRLTVAIYMRNRNEINSCKFKIANIIQISTSDNRYLIWHHIFTVDPICRHTYSPTLQPPHSCCYLNYYIIINQVSHIISCSPDKSYIKSSPGSVNKIAPQHKTQSVHSFYICIYGEWTNQSSLTLSAKVKETSRLSGVVWAVRIRVQYVCRSSQHTQTTRGSQPSYIWFMRERGAIFQFVWLAKNPKIEGHVLIEPKNKQNKTESQMTQLIQKFWVMNLIDPVLYAEFT